MKTRLSLLSGIGLLALSAGSAAAQAPADSNNVPTITVTDTKSKAVQVAPSVAPLDAVQPESLVSRAWIQNNDPLNANYDDVIKFTPSVSSVSPNGPGLMENQILSIRGFQDGQFNVTFDGIPWGDANDFTHHTTSYFMAHDIGSVLVDRGPGTAATIGNATFGGTVALSSKDPAQTLTLNPYGSYGSFNTSVVGGEIDSGAISKYGNATFLVDAEGLSSDGYLTNASQSRQNVFAKYVQPIGPNTTVTVVGMYNQLDQHFSIGSTAAQLAEFGPNYGLNTNTASPSYFGYNHDVIHTDFEYVALKSTFGDGWSVDAKAYTYAYYHYGTQAQDTSGVAPNSLFTTNPTILASGVAGNQLENDYRSFGTIDRVQRDFDFGDIQLGIWFDHQKNVRSLADVNLAANNAPDPFSLVSPSGNSPGIERLIHQWLDTVSPFVQADVKPIEGLTISPGLKYVSFTRNISADDNQASGSSTGGPLQYNKTFDQVLPSVEVLYKVTPQWSAYAQAANGFLAPNENTTYRSSAPQGDPLAPQSTWNYQFGTSYQNGPISVSADAYYINWQNFVKHTSVNGQTIFTNGGGAHIQGLEAEATYVVGWGASIYANATVNSAKFTSNAGNAQSAISDSPKETAALGILYDHSGLTGSLLGKFVGSRYGDAADAGGTNNIGLDPYFTMDMALGYTFGDEGGLIPVTTANVQITNLTDSTKIYSVPGTAGDGSTPLFWTIPGRAVFASLSTKF